MEGRVALWPSVVDVIRFCSNYRECGNTTTFPSISAEPYLWRSRPFLGRTDAPPWREQRGAEVQVGRGGPPSF